MQNQLAKETSNDVIAEDGRWKVLSLRCKTDLQKKQAMISLQRMADENDLQKKHAMISLQRMADENDLQKKQAMI